MDLKGKKLLILGANPETTPIVEVAKSMGIYTIVTDYNPAAPAKSVSDKAYDIDCMDVDALECMATNESVDGVMVGVADTLLRPYQELCARLSLPCVGTRHQIEVLSTKDLFKTQCEKCGIHGVPVYCYDAKNPGTDGASMTYPVLVKPVDNCSGKGMSVCHDEEELKQAIAKAKESSRSGRFMIEKYMTCDDLIAYYTIQDGFASLSMLGDRYTYRTEGTGPVCVADIYPSKYTNKYIDDYDWRFKKMLTDLGVKNGVFLIQMFVEDDIPYVYDPGFRLQGGAQHLNIAAVNGFDQRKMLIEFALTGKMGEEDIRIMDDVRLRGKTAGSLWFLLREGTIGSIRGIEQARKDSSVINVLQRFDVGDTITSAMQGTEQQVFARLHIVCDTRAQYKSVVAKLMEEIRVEDLDGRDMVLWGDFRAESLPDWEA